MIPIYKETYRTNFYDVDAFGNPKLSRITERLLISAEAHSELLGWGHEYLQSECGVAMVLIKNHVKILNKIRVNDKIELTTWPLPRVYPIITRHFKAKNIDTNEPIWEATVECVLMDVKTRTIANGEKLKLALPDPSDEISSDISKSYRFNRRERNDLMESSPLKVFDTIARYSDLDYNGHLNSARYVEFAEDALGVDFFKKNKVSEIDVQYSEEIKPDEKIEIDVYEKENGFYLIGKTRDSENNEIINFEVSLLS